MNEKNLHYTDVGTSEVALVFLHYFGGSSRTWAKFIAILSARHRCIAVDLPGFGDSPAEPEKLSVGDWGQAVAQLIELLALKRYVVVGHSMGGKIALSLASLQPFGLTALVLIAPSPSTPEPMTTQEQKELLTAYGNKVALATLLRTITARPLANAAKESILADNLRAARTSWNWWVEFGSQEDISPRLAAGQVPVLVISGEQDPKFSSSFLRDALLPYFPLATFIEVPQAGHLIPVEAPSATAKAIARFIKKQLQNVAAAEKIKPPLEGADGKE